MHPTAPAPFLFHPSVGPELVASLGLPALCSSQFHPPSSLTSTVPVSKAHRKLQKSRSSLLGAELVLG